MTKDGDRIINISNNNSKCEFICLKLWLTFDLVYPIASLLHFANLDDFQFPILKVLDNFQEF